MSKHQCSLSFHHILFLRMRLHLYFPHQGTRAGSAPLPQQYEPCWSRPHLLRPSTQRPSCPDDCRTRTTRRRGTRQQRQDHDGLSGWHTGPLSPPPRSTASSTHWGYERWLYASPTSGLQVNGFVCLLVLSLFPAISKAKKLHKIFCIHMFKLYAQCICRNLIPITTDAIQ